MRIQLEDRRVLVTAGASGIGWAMSVAFAEAGAQVHVCDIDDGLLETAASRGMRTSRADVSSGKDVEAMFRRIEDDWNGLDVLVNNAGIAGPTKLIEEVSDAEWSRTVAVNLTGEFLCVRSAVPMMRRQKSGCIINMSSTAGRLGMPMKVPYSATKYTVRGMTDALAIELGGDNIRVNAFLPGLVDGSPGQRIVEEQAVARGIDTRDYLSAMLHYISLHALISSQEMAAMAVYLASDLGHHISGQPIGICGNFESYRSLLNIQPTALSFGEV